MAHPLEQKMHEKREEVKRLADAHIEAERAVIAVKHAIEIANAELAAFEMAFSYINPKGAQPKLTRNRSENTMPIGTWAKVLVAIDNSGLKQFKYDDILAKAHEMGLKPQKGSVRALMMNYCRKKTCQRIGDGVFALTEEGRERLGINRLSFAFDEDEI